MCDLCDANKNIVQKERERLLDVSKRLHKHANQIAWMADGTILPHTEEAERAGNEGVRLIGLLAREWL
jgi:hypothetical protein